MKNGKEEICVLSLLCRTHLDLNVCITEQKAGYFPHSPHSQLPLNHDVTMGSTSSLLTEVGRDFKMRVT